MGTSTRGFASMDEATRKKVASQGGSASGGNFKNDPHRASIAGKKGAASQSVEAKAEGGKNSRRNT